MAQDQQVSGGPVPERAASGLCASCRNAREVRNERGSVFVLCELGLTRPDEFVKYPRLPVVKCGGYEGRDDSDS